MDSPYGAGIDPLPYLGFAYFLGLTLLFGYGFLAFMMHGKLAKMREALPKEESPKEKQSKPINVK